MKKSFFIAGLITVLAVLWIGSGLLNAPDPAPAPLNGAAAPPVMQVRVETLQAANITEDVTMTGRTQASRRVQLRSEVAGQLQALERRRGDRVDGEEIIARIDQGNRAARVEEAQRRLNQREIEYNAARQLAAEGHTSRVRLAQAHADMEAARATLTDAQLQLAHTEIRAPFDSIIFRQHVEIGDYVGIGDPLFTLVDLDPLEIRGFVTERDITRIRPGVPVTARLAGGATAEGTVTYIAPAADEDTRTFAVEISLPNGGGALVDGLTAEVRIPLAPQPAHRISPAVLTLNDDGQVGVKTVDAASRVEFVPVRIVSDHPDHMWVAGLPETARVITVGQEFVRPGQTVNAIERDDEQAEAASQ